MNTQSSLSPLSPRDRDILRAIIQWAHRVTVLSHEIAPLKSAAADLLIRTPLTEREGELLIEALSDTQSRDIKAIVAGVRALAQAEQAGALTEEIEATIEEVEAEELFGDHLIPTLDGPVPALPPVEIVLSALRRCGAESKTLQYACDIARRMTWNARTAEAVAQRIRNLAYVSKTALRLALQSEARKAPRVTEPTPTFPAPAGASPWERRLATPLHLLND